MPNFDLSNYVDVAERVEQFYADHPSPEGRLETELLNVGNWTDKQTQFIVRALVMVGDVCLSTGLAEESLGGAGANKLAALENAETSAIGRALANAGYQTNRNGTRQRPSREEMEKVSNNPADALGDLLDSSGWIRDVQHEIVETAVGRPVPNLASLNEDELAKAMAAVESALTDQAQLEEDPF